MRPSLLILATVVVAVFAALALSTEAVPRETLSQPADDFTTDNARAMDRMMVAMSVPPSGNVDRDFVATMVPHHQGAIDMALAELRYGHDETLRRMAQETIVEQRQEIDAMHLASSRLPDATPGGLAASDVCRPKPTPRSMHASGTNVVKHVTYVGRSPHEVFFTRDGKEAWVTVRGENYVSVIDTATYEEKLRIATPVGPGMQIFSPDGKYGYVCSSFSPETVVVDVATHQIVGHVKQDSPFCPNIAAAPDGKQVWFTRKDIGRTMVFDAHPPFAVIKRFDTGPISNHVNFARTPKGQFAYVTIRGLNEVKVFRTDGDFAQVATIPVGPLPHGLWPSGDGSRIYVGLENGDALVTIDTATN